MCDNVKTDTLCTGYAFVLGPADAVAFYGCTPPPVAYFGFDAILRVYPRIRFNPFLFRLSDFALTFDAESSRRVSRRNVARRQPTSGARSSIFPNFGDAINYRAINTSEAGGARARVRAGARRPRGRWRGRARACSRARGRGAHPRRSTRTRSMRRCCGCDRSVRTVTGGSRSRPTCSGAAAHGRPRRSGRFRRLGEPRWPVLYLADDAARARAARADARAAREQLDEAARSAHPRARAFFVRLNARRGALRRAFATPTAGRRALGRVRGARARGQRRRVPCTTMRTRGAGALCTTRARRRPAATAL